MAPPPDDLPALLLIAPGPVASNPSIVTCADCGTPYERTFLNGPDGQTQTTANLQPTMVLKRLSCVQCARLLTSHVRLQRSRSTHSPRSLRADGALALEPVVENGMARFTSKELKNMEVLVQGYVLWGQVHVGWETILSHPWEKGHGWLEPVRR